MTFLTPHLPFHDRDSDSATADRADGVAGVAHPGALPPSGSHLLITDTIPSPGHFAVYHLVSAALARKRRVGRVGVDHSSGLSRQRYSVIADGTGRVGRFSRRGEIQLGDCPQKAGECFDISVALFSAWDFSEYAANTRDLTQTLIRG
jgi:hypothetical protein